MPRKTTPQGYILDPDPNDPDVQHLKRDGYDTYTHTFKRFTKTQSRGKWGRRRYGRPQEGWKLGPSLGDHVKVALWELAETAKAQQDMGEFTGRLTPARRLIIRALLDTQYALTAGEMARVTRVSREAIAANLQHFADKGWVTHENAPAPRPAPGRRPTQQYTLVPAARPLFEKLLDGGT